MTKSVIEEVRFKLAEGVEDAAFLSQIDAMRPWLMAQGGFVRRRLSKGDDGTWLDHLEWASMDEARAAGQALMGEPSLAPFMACIDPASVSLRHSPLAAAQDA